MLQEDETLAHVLARFPQEGRVRWLGVRAKPRLPVVSVERMVLLEDCGIEGDHGAWRTGGKRQVTLIQWEHLSAVAALIGRDDLDPALLRRNIAVAGINLAALHDRRFRLGEALLEENLGPGGLNAMRGHGGITARIIARGAVACGDPVRYAG